MFSNAKVTSFKESYKKQAETLLTEVFPLKITELNELYNSKELNLSQVAEMRVDLNIPVPLPILINNDTGNESPPPSTKKRKISNDTAVTNHKICGTEVVVLPNGPVPHNLPITRLIQTIKPYILDLIDHANKIKMWVAFLIPKIEDGNNFGVSIQEETLSEARQIETEAATYLDQISRYYLARARLISKVARYPHIDDYRISVQEHDEKEFISLRLTVCELRNHYAILHDVINKNVEKIIKPRNMNTDTLY